MNFATLKGLTIPEGVVTQIADTQGNVLWEKNTVKTLYFRPNSDIDVSAWTLYPTGSTTAYSLLNEEVADDSSTYIQCSVAAGGYPTLEIGLGCEKTPAVIPRVTGGVFYVRYNNSSNISASFHGYMDGTVITGIIGEGYSTTYRTGTSEITAEGIVAINEYIAANGKFPPFSVYAQFANGGTKAETTNVTQIYLELICGT